MAEVDFSTFYEASKTRGPDPLLVNAVELLGKKGKALDLGAGMGVDASYLLQQGFEVTAVERNRLALAALRKIPNLQVISSSFEKMELPETYDLIQARYVLPFTRPSHFLEVMRKIKNALAPEGIFVGQLLGDRDQWKKEGRNMTFHTKDEAQKIFQGFEVLELNEEEYSGLAASGQLKHWHVFHIIARKPEAS